MTSRLGHRLEVEGCKGTVMYEGSVDGTKGSWLGVEWDDPSRGKHDGTHAGVSYFKAKGPNSASFIREAKANFGKSFMRAVNERYRTRLEPEVAAQMHVRGSTDQITAVKLVGNEQIAERQSRIDRLEDVHVSDMRVRGPDDFENDDLSDSRNSDDDDDDIYPVNCVSLGLAGNLISSWEDVAAIARPMSRLHSLHVDENRIPPLPQDRLYSVVDAFQSLKTATLTKMDLDWPSVASCFPMWPALEELVLSNNSIASISSTSGNDFPFPPRLRLINLDCNPLFDWNNILPFASLPHLDYLSLAECQLQDIDEPVSFLRAPTFISNIPPFPSLRHLNIRDNSASSWRTISALSQISSLKEFVLLRNPVMTHPESAETSRQILLVKMPSLTRLNHVYVDAKERRGAEIDYFKKFAGEYLNVTSGTDADAAAVFRFDHPTYDRLVDAFGQPEAAKTEDKPNVLKKSLISVAISLESAEIESSADENVTFPTIKKKIPASMSVQKVKMMAAKAWKGGNLLARDLQVKVVSEERSFVIDNEMKEIGFFGVTCGDQLVLSKKSNQTPR